MEDLNTHSSIVRLAVRSWLLGRPEAELEARASNCDWARVQNLARLNKLGVVVPLGLKRSLGATPTALERPAVAYRAATLQINAMNLATVRHAVGLLEAENVPCAVFKGPVQQLILYGDAFVKPAGDVDLLVAPYDFTRASSVLRADGYRLPEAFSSPWWWRSLGEQHHISISPGRCPVDLHHRTQQPGCPAPSRPARFLADAKPLKIAPDASVQALSSHHAALLAAMNLVKAMIHREAALGHVCDVARWRLDADDEQFALARAEARRQGLANTFDVALRAADLVLGLRFSAELPHDLETLAMAAAEPDADLVQWPRRRRILYSLCDAKLNFPREFAWTLIGEGHRRMFNAAPAKSAA